MNSDEAMRRAIDLGRQMMRSGEGRPFGCVILRNGEVIGEGCNSMDRDNDPTAHGEVEAIRDACRRLKTLDLAGAELYTSCEPCPMCTSVMYLAGISKLYYAAWPRTPACLAATPAACAARSARRSPSAQWPASK